MKKLAAWEVNKRVVVVCGALPGHIFGVELRFFVVSIAKYRFDSFVITKLAEAVVWYICLLLAWLGLICVMTRANLGKRVSLALSCFQLRLVSRVLQEADFICQCNVCLAQSEGGRGNL